MQLNKECEKMKKNAVEKIRNKDDWEYYANIIGDRVRKEWNSFGKTKRDWCKTKVITFDE